MSLTFEIDLSQNFEYELNPYTKWEQLFTVEPNFLTKLGS